MPDELGPQSPDDEVGPEQSATDDISPDGAEAEEPRAATVGANGPARPAGTARPAPRGRRRQSFTARHDRSVHRLPLILAILGLLIAGGLVDRTGVSHPKTTTTATLPPVPAAAPVSALSSSWICGGATNANKGTAPGQVVIANSGSTAVTGTITLVASNGHMPVKVPVTVGALSRTTVPEQIPGGTPWIGALVTMAGGGVGVEQETSSTAGMAATPCATTGSNQWYFATGATRINQDVEVSLINPYPTSSIVDLSFTTDQGQEEPTDFQAINVPAGGMTAVDLRTHLRRRNAIATTVTARSGRVVAWETNVVTPPASGAVLAGSAQASQPNTDPSSPIAGVTNVLGSASGGTEWVWPDGISGDGVDENYVVFNPTAQVANVQLSLQLQGSQGQAEPFSLTIQPDEVANVDAGQQTRIPPGVSHSAVLRSTNGVPVVAERTLSAGPPSNRKGLGDLLGGRLSANEWLLPAGQPSSTLDEYVVLYNPGTTPVTANFNGLSGGLSTPLASLTNLSVAAGGRLAVRINDHNSTFNGAIDVKATGPIYTEQDFYGAGKASGIGLSFGIPIVP